VHTLELDRHPDFGAAPQAPSRWRDLLGLPVPAPLSPENLAIEGLFAGLRVDHSRQSRIVEIAYTHSDPALAARIVTALVEQYVRHSAEAQWAGAQQTGELLKKQLTEFRDTLQVSERRLQQYTVENELVITGDDQSIAKEKLRSIQDELAVAQAERIAKQSEFELVESSPPDTIPAVVDSPTLREIALKLTDLRRARVALDPTLLARHVQVEEVQNQIAVLETALRRERNNILQRIQNDRNAAVRRESMLSDVFADQVQQISDEAAKRIQYNALKREVDSNRQIYQMLLGKANEAGIASAIRASTIRIIDEATEPARAAKPRVMMNAALGTIVGGMLGAILVLIRVGLDRTIRMPGVATAWLNVPELGAIPLLSADGRRLGRRDPDRRGIGDGNFPDAIRRAALPAELTIWQREHSIVADSFRATLTSILLSDPSMGPLKVFVITSPKSNDGKTTVASNLAIALAEIRQRTLLIDADLRRPTLHGLFRLDNSFGLTSILRDTEPLHQYHSGLLAQPTRIPQLSVLTAGPRTSNPTSLLASSRMRSLLARVCDEFNFVLIDTPPLMFPDARQIGHLAGSVILVFRASTTSQQEALEARALLDQDGTPLRGCILNAWASDTRPAKAYARDA
jgi:succinoglycan biosynthesis transport protein ExoP